MVEMDDWTRDKMRMGMNGSVKQSRGMNTPHHCENVRTIPTVSAKDRAIEDNSSQHHTKHRTSPISDSQRANDTSCLLGHLSPKRSFSLQLPSVKTMSVPSLAPVPMIQHDSLSHSHSEQDIGQGRCRIPLSESSAPLCGVVPPLTPPIDDMPILKFDEQLRTSQLSGTAYSCSEHHEPSHRTQNPQSTNTTTLDQGLSQSLNQTDSSILDMPPWIVRACQTIYSSSDAILSRDSIHLVSQILPSRPRGNGFRPTVEDVLRFLQSNVSTLPYITITHAVPEATVMEELPKTPPSTPNLRHDANDYFSADQTIFTHAAVVPIHHTHDRTETRAAVKLAHQIAAPGSTQISILERYIPPTMPEEIEDFFSTSNRSYLVDRLSELSANNGSLLLVYPTRTGGSAFVKRHVGPVIDPYLRQFILLNSLTSDVASTMGKMRAVDSMIDFPEMERRTIALCGHLSRRLVARGPRSTFAVTHSEKTSVRVNRATWMSWYIEQEQPRLRQNVVDYHQSGGRMPVAEGSREVTVGMLARDFIDGLQKCQPTASDAEMEVGIFVITRSTCS